MKIVTVEGLRYTLPGDSTVEREEGGRIVVRPVNDEPYALQFVAPGPYSTAPTVSLTPAAERREGVAKAFGWLQ